MDFHQESMLVRLPDPAFESMCGNLDPISRLAFSLTCRIANQRIQKFPCPAMELERSAMTISKHITLSMENKEEDSSFHMLLFVDESKQWERDRNLREAYARYRQSRKPSRKIIGPRWVRGVDRGRKKYILKAKIAQPCLPRPEKILIRQDKRAETWISPFSSLRQLLKHLGSIFRAPCGNGILFEDVAPFFDENNIYQQLRNLKVAFSRIKRSCKNAYGRRALQKYSASGIMQLDEDVFKSSLERHNFLRRPVEILLLDRGFNFRPEEFHLVNAHHLKISIRTLHKGKQEQFFHAYLEEYARGRPKTFYVAYTTPNDNVCIEQAYGVQTTSEPRIAFSTFPGSDRVMFFIPWHFVKKVEIPMTVYTGPIRMRSVELRINENIEQGGELLLPQHFGEEKMSIKMNASSFYTMKFGFIAKEQCTLFYTLVLALGDDGFFVHPKFVGKFDESSEVQYFTTELEKANVFETDFDAHLTLEYEHGVAWTWKWRICTSPDGSATRTPSTDNNPAQRLKCF